MASRQQPDEFNSVDAVRCYIQRHTETFHRPPAAVRGTDRLRRECAEAVAIFGVDNARAMVSAIDGVRVIWYPYDD